MQFTTYVTFIWRNSPQEGDKNIRARFFLCRIFIEFDETLQTIMETDASNQAIAVILPQSYVSMDVNTFIQYSTT